MTDITRTFGIFDQNVKVHKKDSQPPPVGSSCSRTSTPEPYGRNDNQKSIEMVTNHRNPLLRKMNGHSNSESTSSTTTTGPTSREVNYCEVYYLSPSKRKNCDSLQQQIGPLIPQMHRTSSMKKTQKCNSIDSAASWMSSISQKCRNDRSTSRSSPTDTATVYSKFINSRPQHEQGLDNFDICSHYSDSAAIPMPSRYNNSVICNTSNNSILINGSTSMSGFCHDGGIGSSNSSIAIVSNGPRTNNVTFSNRTEEHQIHSNRGSLRRSKGRSNQSLCSCDVGDDTEIIPDPNRPLYQYSLDRKNKKHTYTCEQNAQILMRLEREKIRKLSGTPSVSHCATSNSSMTIDKQGNEINQIGLNNSFDTSSFDYHENNTSLESDSTAEIDNIPPPPPPPSSIIRSHQLQSGFSKDPTKSSYSKSSHEFESILNDCTTTILNCANVSHIAKQHQHQQQHQQHQHQQQQPKQENPTKYSQTTTKPSSALHENREHFKLSNMPQPCIRDDAFLSSTKSKGEDSMYFYHQETPIFVANYENRPIPSIMGKYNTIGPSSYNAKQLADYHHHQKQQQQQQQQFQYQHHQQQQNDEVELKLKQGQGQRQYLQQRFEQNNKGSCNLGHFDSNNLTNNGKYFSQSLTNFSLNCSADNNDQQKYKQKEQVHNYHENTKYNQPSSSELEMMNAQSNSFTQDQDHNDRHHHWHHPNYNHDTIGSRLGLTDITQNITSNPYTKFQRTTSLSNGMIGSCSFGGELNLINSSFTTLDSSTSGLKGKFYEQEHLHRHHHHPHHQQQPQQPEQQQIQQTQLQQQQQFHSSTSSIMPWKHRQCPSHGSSSSGTNSLRFDAAKHWLAVSSILLIIGAASVAVPLALRVAASAPFEERLRVATQLLDQVPLIDGHNDLPWNIRKFLHNKLNDFNFDEDLRNVMPWARSNWSHTDLQRLKKGRVAAQFWAAYVPCEAQHRDAVQLTLEQIDVIKRLTERYSPQLTTCTSASDIMEAHKNLQLCSLTGVEGGHSLGGSLAVLRTLYAIGVRYMTLTSTCHTPWADSSYADAPTFNVKHGGLTAFGKTIIREMNRLGMIVDLSHVSTGTMRDALDVSEAPVIFSHSSAYELCNSSRNVQDDILQSIAKNGGLVMVNFYSRFLSCSDNSTVHDAVAHINHIKRVAGIDHVGLGAGFDGINFTPKGLEDVSSYPTLFAELLGEGWSIDDLTKLAGGNFLRVMLEVEKLRDLKKLTGVKPFEDHPNFRTEDPYNCTSS